MEIRRLKTKDFFTVATMLSKMAGDTMRNLSGETNDAASVGASFISNAFKYAESDIKDWLADLAGIAKDAFDELPFDAPIEIIERLAEQENLTSFLQRVMGLKDKLTKRAT